MFAAVGFMVLAVPAHLGSGDIVQARNTESVIESVVPSLPNGVTVDIVGFDALLRLRARGHDVEVPGYTGEPYLRIARNGDVAVNEASMTALLNDERGGNADLSNFAPRTVPEWRIVGSQGEVMWHDHRSHWMSPKPPAPIDATGRVQDFEVSLVVDGVATSVSGAIFLRPSHGAGWWLLGLPALFAAVLAALHRPRLVSGVLGAGSVGGVVVGFVQWQGLPEGARITPVLMLFAGLALAVVVVGAMAGRLQRAHLVPVMNAGAGVSLLGAVWLCADQVRSAYVPGLVAGWPVRALLPVMLGISVVAIVDGVRRVFRVA